MSFTILLVGAVVTLGVGMVVSSVNETAGGIAFLVCGIGTLWAAKK